MKGCPVTLSMCSWVLGFNPSSCDRSWNKCHLALEIFLKNVEVTYMWGFRFFFGTPSKVINLPPLHPTVTSPPGWHEAFFSFGTVDGDEKSLVANHTWDLWKPYQPQKPSGYSLLVPTNLNCCSPRDFQTNPSTVCCWWTTDRRRKRPMMSWRSKIMHRQFEKPRSVGNCWHKTRPKVSPKIPVKLVPIFLNPGKNLIWGLFRNVSPSI